MQKSTKLHIWYKRSLQLYKKFLQNILKNYIILQKSTKHKKFYKMFVAQTSALFCFENSPPNNCSWVSNFDIP